MRQQAEIMDGYLGRFRLWRSDASRLSMIILSLAFACLTGISAQIRIPLPWTPVPLTMQTLAVMMCAFMLGRWGAVSQLMYVAMGAAGIPWFTGSRGSVAVLLGPTAGYLAGFVIAAWVIGALLDGGRFRGFTAAFALFIFAEIFIILACGTACLQAWLIAVRGTAVSIPGLVSMGVLPFIPGCIIKSFIAASAASLLRHDFSAKGGGKGR